MTKTASLVAIGALLLVAGCKNKEAQLEGKWKVKDVTSTSSGPQVEMAKNMLKSSTIEFKKDKKFSMSMVFPIEGTWTLEGSSVSMKMTSLMGMSIEQAKEMAKKSPNAKQENINAMDKPMVATMSEDGKTLSLTPEGGNSTIVYEKDTAS